MAIRTMALVFVVALFLSVAAYRIALPVQRQYGKYFKALFDQFQHNIALQPALDALSDVLHDPRLRRLRGRDGYRQVWRYLQWDKHRPPGAVENEDIWNLQN